MITELGFYVEHKLREFAPRDKRESVGAGGNPTISDPQYR